MRAETLQMRAEPEELVPILLFPSLQELRAEQPVMEAGSITSGFGEKGRPLLQLLLGSGISAAGGDGWGGGSSSSSSEDGFKSDDGEAAYGGPFDGLAPFREMADRLWPPSGANFGADDEAFGEALDRELADMQDAEMVEEEDGRAGDEDMAEDDGTSDAGSSDAGDDDKDGRDDDTGDEGDQQESSSDEDEDEEEFSEEESSSSEEESSGEEEEEDERSTRKRIRGGGEGIGRAGKGKKQRKQKPGKGKKGKSASASERAAPGKLPGQAETLRAAIACGLFFPETTAVIRRPGKMRSRKPQETSSPGAPATERSLELDGGVLQDLVELGCSTAGLTADHFGIFCEVHERLMAVRRKFAPQLRRDGDEFLLVTLAPGASTASAKGQVTVKMLVVACKKVEFGPVGANNNGRVVKIGEMNRLVFSKELTPQRQKGKALSAKQAREVLCPGDRRFAILTTVWQPPTVGATSDKDTKAAPPCWFLELADEVEDGDGPGSSLFGADNDLEAWPVARAKNASSPLGNVARGLCKCWPLTSRWAIKGEALQGSKAVVAKLATLAALPSLTSMDTFSMWRGTVSKERLSGLRAVARWEGSTAQARRAWWRAGAVHSPSASWSRRVRLSLDGVGYLAQALWPPGDDAGDGRGKDTRAEVFYEHFSKLHKAHREREETAHRHYRPMSFILELKEVKGEGARAQVVSAVVFPSRCPVQLSTAEQEARRQERNDAGGRTAGALDLQQHDRIFDTAQLDGKRKAWDKEKDRSRRTSGERIPDRDSPRFMLNQLLLQPAETPSQAPKGGGEIASPVVSMEVDGEAEDQPSAAARLRLNLYYVKRAFSPRSPLTLYGNLLSQCTQIRRAMEAANGNMAQAFEYSNFKVYVVDDSSDLGPVKQVIDFFLRTHPGFSQNVVYVPMAVRDTSAAGGSSWRGIGLKPSWKLLSWKTTFALKMIQEDMDKDMRDKKADDAVFVPGLDDDDVTTAEYFEKMAQVVAEGIVQRRLHSGEKEGGDQPCFKVACHRPLRQLTIDPLREKGKRLVFLQAPKGMFSAFGAGACFHYPLSALTAVKWALPEVQTAEDINGLRLFHHLCKMDAFKGAMAVEVKFDRPAYLERVRVRCPAPLRLVLRIFSLCRARLRLL